MNLLRWYQKLPIWAQHMSVSAYGLRLKQQRFGDQFLRERALLRQIDHSNARLSEEVANYRMARVIREAFTFVPHYRDLAARLRIRAEDVSARNIAELPILSKEEVRADPRRFVSERISSRDRRKIFTSGTTGSPLEVTCTTAAIQENYAHFARFLGWHGVTPFDKNATFAGRPLVPIDQRAPPYWRRNIAMSNYQYSSYHLSPATAAEYLAHLKETRPTYIDSYPSSIFMLAKCALAESWTPPNGLKVIVTSSETLEEEHRHLIGRAFGCQVRDQYGSAEMVAFLGECSHGRYHAFPEFGHVEIIPRPWQCSEEGAGELVATGFINLAMPLIRYATGDEAFPSESECECGRVGKTFSRIGGRKDDVILSPDGMSVGRLDPVFKGASGVIECQIEQINLDRLLLRVVLASGHTSESLEPIIEGLRMRWSRVGDIDVRIVDSIPRGANGKFRACVGMRGIAPT